MSRNTLARGRARCTGETYQQALTEIQSCGLREKAIPSAQTHTQQKTEASIMRLLLTGTTSRQTPLQTLIQSVRPRPTDLKITVPMTSVTEFAHVLASGAFRDSRQPSSDHLVFNCMHGAVIVTGRSDADPCVELQCSWNPLRNILLNSTRAQHTADGIKLAVPSSRCSAEHDALLSEFLRRIALFTDTEALNWLKSWSAWADGTGRGKHTPLPTEVDALLRARSFGLIPSYLTTLEYEEAQAREANGRRADDSRKRNSVFVSYSYNDRAWLEEIKLHLTAVLRRAVINVFDDSEIPPGERWLDRIRVELSTAKVALLLVSTPFLASHFVREVEIPELLRAEKEGMHIMCLFLGHSAYETVPEISQFQAVNDPLKPLSGVRKIQRDRILVSLAKTIAEVM